VAAAAGGCVLVRREALAAIGGFAAIAGALIDDCALARCIKDAGGRTWIGLTRSARSLRAGAGFGELWRTVVRSAYTQLRYSPAWLALCTVLMVVAFAGPLAGIAAAPAAGGGAALAGATAWLVMAATYAPTLRYYQRSALWAAALPFVGLCYLAMTWHSALVYLRGTRSQWKGRRYAVSEGGGGRA